VTGAASGIGAAVAEELTRRGWMVAGFDLSPSDTDLHQVVDMADERAVTGAVTSVVSEVGPVDLAVSAAGHYAMVPFADIEATEWTRMLRVHLGGALHLARAVLPGMLDRRAGSIVPITSELAIGGGGGDAPHAQVDPHGHACHVEHHQDALLRIERNGVAKRRRAMGGGPDDAVPPPAIGARRGARSREPQEDGVGA